MAKVLVRLDKLVEGTEVAFERALDKDLIPSGRRIVRAGSPGDVLGRTRARVVQLGAAPSGADAGKRRGGEAARV
jgi:hypothetical protein